MKITDTTNSTDGTTTMLELTAAEFNALKYAIRLALAPMQEMIETAPDGLREYAVSTSRQLDRLWNDGLRGEQPMIDVDDNGERR